MQSAPTAAAAPVAEATAARAPFPPSLIERIGFLLTMVKGGAEALCSAALAPMDLHVKQFGLLTVLANEGAHSQQELAEWIRLDRTTMVALVDSLEERGLVRRERNPEDRRAYRVRLTPEGRRLQRRAGSAMRAAEEELLGALAERESKQLRALLARVAADIGRPPAEARVPER